MDRPIIKNLKTGKIHIVHAAGGPGDGGLSGFYTYCGRKIEHLDAIFDTWEEVEEVDPTCEVCKRSHIVGAEYRTSLEVANAANAVLRYFNGVTPTLDRLLRPGVPADDIERLQIAVDAYFKARHG